MPSQPSPSLGARVVTLFVGLLVMAASPVHAQVADGVIEIVAVDESGAALPGVSVAILRPDTGGSGGATTIPTPLDRPPNPVAPLYSGPFIPSPVSQRNRYAGSPDPMSKRFMPWIRW